MGNASYIINALLTEEFYVVRLSHLLRVRSRGVCCVQWAWYLVLSTHLLRQTAANAGWLVTQAGAVSPSCTSSLSAVNCSTSWQHRLFATFSCSMQYPQVHLTKQEYEDIYGEKYHCCKNFHLTYYWILSLAIILSLEQFTILGLLTRHAVLATMYLHVTDYLCYLFLVFMCKEWRAHMYCISSFRALASFRTLLRVGPCG